MPVLPGLHLGAVREGGGGAPEGDHALPPLQPLRHRQAVRVLDGEGVPGGLRHVRGQRHPVQPRVGAAGGELRHEKDYPCRRADCLRLAGQAPAGEPGQQTGLGLRKGLCGVHVADAPAREAGGFRHRYRRTAHGAGVYHPGLCPRRHRPGLAGYGPGGKGHRPGHGKVAGGGEPCLVPSHGCGQPVG